MKKYDLAVIGGGFAGVAAALSAARNGAKVLVVEKSNCLGGAAVNSLVNPFMPYWTEIDGERFDLSVGIFKEIFQNIEKQKNKIVIDLKQKKSITILYDLLKSKNIVG